MVFDYKKHLKLFFFNMKFELNEKELDEYNEFIKKHKKCKFNSSIGGKITIKFTPTGLGNIIEVCCNDCGKHKYITDINNW